jgi:hypothetical protein
MVSTEPERRELGGLQFVLLLVIFFPLNLILFLIWAKKPKRSSGLLLFGIPVAIEICVAGIALVFMFYNPFLAPEMVDFYSNDSNFDWFTATVEDASPTYFAIKNLTITEGDEPKELTSYHRFKVFSPDLSRTWERFDPYPGLEFRFRGTLKKFFIECPCAIVEIERDGETILTFEEGKAALLEWARQVH